MKKLSLLLLVALFVSSCASSLKTTPTDAALKFQEKLDYQTNKP